jgi:hypothetical protein
MKYLIICMLFVSCSIFRKSVNEVNLESKQSIFSIKDSTGKITIDSSGRSDVIQWLSTAQDSGFVKITEEEIREILDSSVTHREIKRTIKEKGQKRTEQSITTIRHDTATKKVNQNSNVARLQLQNSSSIKSTSIKEVKRDAFLPWWIWLIVLAAIAIGWWKRNPIIDFFTPKNK